MWHRKCDQIELFLKVPEAIFLTKVAQILGNFVNKKCFGYFWVNWAVFIKASTRSRCHKEILE